MSTVAGPVSAAAAMPCTGENAELVQYSVAVPISTPVARPAEQQAQHADLHGKKKDMFRAWSRMRHAVLLMSFQTTQPAAACTNRMGHQPLCV